MTMKESFLKEVKIGSCVELAIGPKILKGIIVSLDISTVRIKKDDNREAIIALDNIGYYELIEDKTSQPASSDITSKIKLNKISIEKEEKHQNTETISNSSQNTTFDFNAIESRGLIFETYFWQNNINFLKMNPAIKDKAKELNTSGELSKKIAVYLDKFLYCAKINEFDPKFGRLQPIILGIDELCTKYNEDFLYELLAIILISSESTYKELLNKVCTNSVIRLSDAVVCFKKRRYEVMAYYCSEFFSNVELTEQNFDNFLFAIPYLVKNGYNDVLKVKQEEVKRLSKARQEAFAAVYNKAKSSFKTPSYMPIPSTGKIYNSKNQNSDVMSKILEEKLKDKVKKLVRSGKFQQAYKLVEKRFKENPENKDISELLQYVGRVKSNASKFKLPTDESFYAKALREWHLYENIPSAKSYFLLSINKKESKYFSAIMDYVELIMHVDGEKAAVNTLKSYEKTIRTLEFDSNRTLEFDSNRTLEFDSKIKYFEKMASLYSKGKDYNNLLMSLNSLEQLYMIKLENSTIDNSDKKINKAKVAGIFFRISQCYAKQGEYQLSIDTVKNALAKGHNLYACVKQIVFCYISQKIMNQHEKL